MENVLRRTAEVYKSIPLEKYPFKLFATMSCHGLFVFYAHKMNAEYFYVPL